MNLGLGCVFVRNGWVKGEKGKVLVEIGVGGLAQVNYDIARMRISNGGNTDGRNSDARKESDLVDGR